MEGASQQSFDIESEDMNQMLVEKTHELFALCDHEQKGFITKSDMHYLKGEFNLTVEQLEDVFENLDQDCNGKLTLNEFTIGFGSYLGLQISQYTQESEKAYESDNDPEDEDARFYEMLDKFEAREILREHDEIRIFWCRLRKQEPELLESFEEFIGKITTDMKRSQLDFTSLEHALKQKSSVYNQEVRTLYEEMEHQIVQEKERVLLEEKAKERKLREELELELQTKDRQLQELSMKHTEMENRFSQLNSTEVETKQENEKLLKEKETLEKMLKQSEERLKSTKEYLDQLRQHEKQEKQDRAKAVLKVSEGIAKDRESLYRQLDLLRAMNRKLRDDKEELEIKKAQESGEGSQCSHKSKPPLCKKGSIMSNYFDTMLKRQSWDSATSVGGAIQPVSSGSISSPLETEEDEVFEEDKDLKVATISESAKFNQSSILSQQQILDQIQILDLKTVNPKSVISSEPNSSEIEMKEISLSRGSTIQRSDSETSGTASNASLTNRTESPKITSKSLRAQPVGATSAALCTADKFSTSSREVSPEDTPQRLFKVVFVGDSGVGKSSFIHRFCFEKFRPTFSATIGIDFQVKSLVAGNHIVAFQLWDTAGQERFRSITKQYFRKADGVVIMYDVTSETSFTNVRNWMTSIQEGAEPFIVLMLIGNKTDLCMNDEQRVVKKNDGRKLSDQYGALFYEASAKSGDNIKESMYAMANLLKVREDQQMEKALRLDEQQQKKKGCCK